MAEVKFIDGTENAIFELSEEVKNCLVLSGEIYGKTTQDEIYELGRQHKLFILANGLSIIYERPNEK